MSWTFTRLYSFVDLRHFALFFDLSRTETDEVPVASGRRLVGPRPGSATKRASENPEDRRYWRVGPNQPPIGQVLLAVDLAPRTGLLDLADGPVAE